MSDRFEVRTGQIWYVRGSKGKDGPPCDVYIEILDMCVQKFGNKYSIVFKERLTHGDEVEERYGFEDLYATLDVGNWQLVDQVGAKGSLTGKE